ncbi:discoidin domain-containing protein [Virgibacillus dakarensis]|uniref:discoidin domain-containing protein n=1 Tax=Virgibacillus dakarensis TaxID=1917889 RepID=UPI000B431B25|nr:discoidin domain-containing protein [Virgibacillus dakarensis]
MVDNEIKKAFSESQKEKANIKVYYNKRSRKINKEIYGLHTPAWNETVFKNGVLAPRLKRELTRINLGFLVYPGGNYGYDFIWNSLNLPTEMDTDQFLYLNELLNTTAKISVNPNASPQLAADWIDYVNNQKQAGVQYWEVADEPYLTMSAKEFIIKVKEFVPVMKSIDPSIKIIANVSASDRDFTKSVIEEVGDYIDVYSIHSLPLPPSQKFSQSSPYSKEHMQNFFRDLLETPEGLRNELNRVKSWVKQVQRDKKVEFHVGSFNSVWSYPEDWTVNSLPVGLWVADMLGTFAEEEVDAAAYWALMNPYPPGNGDYGLFSPEMKPYVNYYPFYLYTNYFGDMLIETKSNTDHLSTYASTSEDENYLYIMIINKSPTNNEIVQFELNNFKPEGNAEAWILDGPTVANHVYDYGLRKETIHTVSKNEKFTWTVPAYSVVAIKIPGEKLESSLEKSPNLARDKRAIASSAAFNTDFKYAKTNDFIPDRAIDGDDMTRWASKTFQRDDEFFEVDLGQMQTFNRIRINWEYWATQYEIYVSNNRYSWEKVADQSNAEREKEPPQPVDIINFDQTIQARYVRIVMYERPANTGVKAGTSQWTPDAFSIWELAVYLKP